MEFIEILRQVFRRIMPFCLYKQIALMYGAKVSSRRIGKAEYSRLRAVSKSHPSKPPEKFTLPNIKHPVYVRPGTSDTSVFESNLLRKSYECVKPDFPVRFIIDAGANVGYSSIYFLHHYSQSHIVAVEPDYDNYMLAELNLKPYSDRVKLLKAAIWPQKTNLRIKREGREDGIQVSSVLEGQEYECVGVDPFTLLRESGFSRINIFKCDIEGSEENLFSENYDRWIQQTDIIVVEIHNKICQKVVYGTMEKYPFDSYRYRDLHVFVRKAKI
jgi:FkbM family methyltransferase